MGAIQQDVEVQPLTQAQVIDIVKLNDPQHFRKSGSFTFKKVTEEQEVVTEINGEVETKNTAKVGDYILTGSVGEQYILNAETFAKRYVVTGENTADSKGECFGNIYRGEPITFIANWGEQMICKTGDYLVSPEDTYPHAYRIEAGAFLNTYKKVED